MSDRPNTQRFDHGATEVETVAMSDGPARTAAATPPAGTAVPPTSPAPRYVPGAEIARGGMGRVVAGTDTRLGREVAIKEALPRGGDAMRFEREVRITARLEHPSIVPLYDAGITPSGRPFYVMRKVSGQPLERLIAERSGPEPGPEPGSPRGKSPLDERLALLPHVLAAANALGHAHRRGIIHRDVKPANILVGDLGETVVIDWGLAKVIGEDDTAPPPPVDAAIAPSGEIATAAGAVFGTPGFMAPEQARAEALDARSDVYSLGATLYHLLAGAPPFPGALSEVLAGAHDPHRAGAALAALAALALPPELTAIVDKAMQFEPARRYPDGAALADDLTRFLAGRLVTAHRYTPAQRLRRFVRRHRASVAVIASSAIVLAVGGVLAIRGIVLEREHAVTAEQAAREGQRAAERARQRETDRADDAVILKARAELERDPTAAIATLATLAPESRRWAQARPIAVEARLRGIVHVYSAELAPRGFELAPDPRFLLAVGVTRGRSTHTTVSILDLERNHKRELLACPGYCTAAWGEGGAAIWVAPGAGGLYAVDVATGAPRPPVEGGKITQLRADVAATRLALLRDDGRAGTVDAAGVHDLPGLAHKVEEVRIAPDGAWTAAVTAHELVVFDRGGRELVRETGALQTATLIGDESGQHLAILAGAGAAAVVVEIDLTGSRASIRHTTPPWQVFRIVYIRDAVYVSLYHAVEMRPLHDLENRGAEHSFVWSSRTTWQGYAAIAADAIQLVGATRRTLWPPSRDQILALAARRGSRYLAAQTSGAIMTWDLGDVLPEIVTTGINGAWLYDDTTAVVTDLVTCDWLDLATGARTRIATPPGVVTWQHPDPATDRQLLLVDVPGGAQRAVVAHRGRAEVTPIDLPGLRRVEFTGDGLVVGTTAGELVVLRDGATPRVVHRFDAPVDTVISNGSWIAAEAAGTLARFDTATGALDTARPAFAIGDAIVTRTGELYLSDQRAVVRWRGRGFDRIATLPDPIATINRIEGRNGLVVTTQQKAIYAVEPDLAEPGRVTRLFFHSENYPRINPSGRFMTVNTIHDESTVLDLTYGTRWRVPTDEPVDSVSPSGHVALLFSRGHVARIRFDVPDDPRQLRDWLIHATNYTPDTGAP